MRCFSSCMSNSHARRRASEPRRAAIVRNIVELRCLAEAQLQLGEFDAAESSLERAFEIVKKTGRRLDCRFGWSRVPAATGARQCTSGGGRARKAPSISLAARARPSPSKQRTHSRAGPLRPQRCASAASRRYETRWGQPRARAILAPRASCTDTGLSRGLPR
jgi:hypothetical protein